MQKITVKMNRIISRVSSLNCDATKSNLFNTISSAVLVDYGDDESNQMGRMYKMKVNIRLIHCFYYHYEIVTNIQRNLLTATSGSVAFASASTIIKKKKKTNCKIWKQQN